MRLLLFLCAGVAWAQSPDVAAGAKTFRSHCAACHGLSGEGGRGPNLAAGVFYHGGSDADLLKTISDGVPGTEMPGLFYSADRIVQVIAYIRSLSTQPRSAATNGRISEGESIYRVTGCAQCHRVKGEGGRLGPDLTAVGRLRSTEYLRQSIVEPDADVPQRYWIVKTKAADGTAISGFRLNEDTYTVQILDVDGNLRSCNKTEPFTIEKKSLMPSYKGRLSAEQIEDLVAYLASLGTEGARI
jgi:putative heme-binding domain-containing protein